MGQGDSDGTALASAMVLGLMALSLSPSSTTNKSQCFISHCAAGEMYAIDATGARNNFERRLMEQGGVSKM